MLDQTELHAARYVGTRRMARILSVVTLPVLMVSAAFGQGNGPEFDAASVKLSAPLPAGMMMINIGGGPGSSDPGRITYNGITLKMLVARAYGIKEYQVEGPAWIDSERYDVIATIPKDSSKEQVSLMTQRLLAERFKLAVHREPKPLAVYALSVGKDGPKLKEVDPDAAFQFPPLPAGAPPPPPPPGSAATAAGRGGGPGLRMMVSPYSRQVSGNTTMARLCDALSNLLDHPVIDQTGLKGTYELNLSWTPDDSEKIGGKLPSPLGPVPPDAHGGDGNAAVEPGPTLAEALQANYGLKLERRKDQADMVVIDHAEKVPTEN